MEAFDAGRSISQADAQRSGRAGEVAIRAHRLQAADGVGHAHRADLRALEGDHFSIVAGFDELNGLRSKD